MTVQVLFEPRFDYARETTYFRAIGNDKVSAEGKHDHLMLSFSRAGLKIENDRVPAKWDLTAEKRVGLILRYNENQSVNFALHWRCGMKRIRIEVPIRKLWCYPSLCETQLCE